jgi:hypothetical protein
VGCAALHRLKGKTQERGDERVAILLSLDLALFLLPTAGTLVLLWTQLGLFFFFIFFIFFTPLCSLWRVAIEDVVTGIDEVLNQIEVVLLKSDDGSVLQQIEIADRYAEMAVLVIV